MTMPMLTHQASHPRRYAKKLIDALWYASLILSFGFTLLLMVLFAFGLAVELKIIEIPPQMCHYLTGDQHLDHFCRVVAPSLE